MHNTLSKALIFIAGMAVGAATSWAILKPYYKKIADEESASVKEAFSRRMNDILDEEIEDAVDENERGEYAERLVDAGYRDIVCHPYIITPDEFEGLDEYETISLTYYADRVLTDDVDNIIPDAEIDDMVGRDVLERIHRDEEDFMFVRNDERKTDYEITRDSRTFSDVCEEYGLHQTED